MNILEYDLTNRKNVNEHGKDQFVPAQAIREARNEHKIIDLL